MSAGARRPARAVSRIQKRNRALILEAGLKVFSVEGFRGATLDRIAAEAGLSKPNLLYYFPSKEAVHVALLSELLDTWLAPLRGLDADGDPIEEIVGYVMRKLDMARVMPRASRLFANEIVQGAPRILDMIEGPLRTLVDDKAALIGRWSQAGRIAAVRPLSPDLLDLGHDPALRRFRCSGPWHSAAAGRRAFHRRPEISDPSLPQRTGTG